MNKILFIVLICLISISFLGCENSNKLILQNIEFSESQKDMLSNIGLTKQNVHCFKLNENIDKKIEVSIDCYKDGILEKNIFSTESSLSKENKLYIYSTLIDDTKFNVFTNGAGMQKEILLNKGQLVVQSTIVNSNKIILTKNDSLLMAKIINNENVSVDSDKLFKDFDSEKDNLLKNNFVFLFKIKIQ